MTTLNNEAATFNQNKYDLHVKDWEDQFNNLNKMLDRHIVQTNGAAKLSQEHQGASHPNVHPFERSGTPALLSVMLTIFSFSSFHKRQSVRLHTFSKN